MNNNNSKTIVWDNIPEWAIFSLEYSIDEELFLPDEGIRKGVQNL